MDKNTKISQLKHQINENTFTIIVLSIIFTVTAIFEIIVIFLVTFMSNDFGGAGNIIPLFSMLPVGCGILLFRTFKSNKALKNELIELAENDSETKNLIVSQKVKIKNVFSITIIILAIVGVFIIGFLISDGNSNKHDDVWDKDPNTWTDQEEDYVNDFFEWQHDYYDD